MRYESKAPTLKQDMAPSRHTYILAETTPGTGFLDEQHAIETWASLGAKERSLLRVSAKDGVEIWTPEVSGGVAGRWVAVES